MRHKRLKICLILAAGLFLLLSLFLPSSLVEAAYSRGLYPWISAVLVTVTGSVPIPITAVGLLLLPFWLVFLWVKGWRQTRREGGSHFLGFLWGLQQLAVLAALLYLLFLVTWGMGYRRTPIGERLGLDSPRNVHRSEVAQLTRQVASAIQRNLPSRRERDWDRALTSLRQSVQNLVLDWEGYQPTLPKRLKLLPAGTLLCMGVSGVISPFLLEVHLDAGLPEAARLAVAAHEMAHICGYCGEADADLLGLTAALRAKDKYVRYAAALQLFMDLQTQTPKQEWNAAFADLPEVARVDLHQASKARRHYRVRTLTRISHTVYDGYLQSQGVEEGYRDYDRGIVLLLRAWRRGLVTFP